MNYSDGSNAINIGKAAETYNLLGGRDTIRLSPYSITYSDRTLDTEGWEKAIIDGGDGIDTLVFNYHLYAIPDVESLIELGEPVDGWTLLTDTINDHVYTASIKNIEIFKGMTDFIGNSEDNHAISASLAFEDISMVGGGGNDLLIVRNSYDQRYTQTITVDGGTGDDQVFVHSNTSNATLILDGGEGFDTLTLGKPVSARWVDCIPCVEITLDAEDLIIGFENLVFAENQKQDVTISNEFLWNMQTDSIVIEGSKRTKIVFTDDIQQVHPALDDECNDGYIHYQIELAETPAVVMDGIHLLAETPIMMDIWIDHDIWVR